MSGVIERVFSKSYISVLSDEERKKVQGDLEENMKEFEGKDWWEYPYTNLAVVIRTLERP